jgi:hypothetical protein
MRSVRGWLGLCALVLGVAGAAVAVNGQPEPRGQPEQLPPPPPIPRVTHGQPATVRVVPTEAVENTFWRGVEYARRVRAAIRWTVTALLACHVLLAVWVFTDIRKRGEGHGIFIALTLLGGFPAAVVYALVRIGDRKS